MLHTIGIVGGGVVGRATARSYMEYADVKVYDVIPERGTHTLTEVMSCEVVFLCLPTPQCDGSLGCDTTAVESFLASVAGSDATMVLRSTVPIGTTRRMAGWYELPNLLHSPEFLTARCAMVDAQLPARNIIGIPCNGGGNCIPTITTEQGPYTKASYALHELYRRRFPGVPILHMASDESEAVKIITNGYFATKIAYMNECNLLCHHLGLDWDRVLKGILLDGRICATHTRIPGPDGTYGYGGACLVKDIASLIHQLESNNLRSDVSRGAYERNLLDRKRKVNKD